MKLNGIITPKKLNQVFESLNFLLYFTVMSKKINERDLSNFKDFIQGVIISTKESIRNIEHISDYDREGINLIPIKGFLIHYMNISYSHIAINISKLFSQSDNEKRSFFKLMNALQNRRYDYTIETIINNNKANNSSRTVKTHEDLKYNISVCISKIIQHEILIKKILDRRNNVYAHAYAPNESSDPSVILPETKEELKEILDLAICVFDLIFGAIYGITWSFTTQFYSIKPVLIDRKWRDNLLKEAEKDLNKSFK